MMRANPGPGELSIRRLWEAGLAGAGQTKDPIAVGSLGQTRLSNLLQKLRADAHPLARPEIATQRSTQSTGQLTMQKRPMQSTGQMGSVQSTGQLAMQRSVLSTSSDSELDIDDEKGSRKGSHPGKPAAVSRKQARRKRRGIVEKRRRDRINHSLSELRRLVPCASEKQGSTKLEKAEILQMTVDHLKVLHTSSGRGYMETPELATDYGVLGFRECLWEVARYLSVTEGLGRSDTPQSRLVSHLSTCASQREAATLESQRQRWRAGCARQAAMSRVRAGVLAGLFPTVSCLRLGQFRRMSPLPAGRVLPMLTNTEPAPPLATATAATSQLQAVKIGQHLWATAVGAF